MVMCYRFVALLGSGIGEGEMGALSEETWALFVIFDYVLVQMIRSKLVIKVWNFNVKSFMIIARP